MAGSRVRQDLHGSASSHWIKRRSRCGSRAFADLRAHHNCAATWLTFVNRRAFCSAEPHRLKGAKHHQESMEIDDLCDRVDRKARIPSGRGPAAWPSNRPLRPINRQRARRAAAGADHAPNVGARCGRRKSGHALRLAALFLQGALGPWGGSVNSLWSMNPSVSGPGGGC